MATILTNKRRNALGSLLTNWFSEQDDDGRMLDTLDYFDVDKIDELINEAIAPAIADAVRCALAAQAKEPLNPATPELLGFAQLVLRGIESGHVKATPFMDFTDAHAESVPMRSIGDLAREVVAKATGAA